MATANRMTASGRIAAGLAIALTFLGVYGMVSTPMLIERWGVTAAGVALLAAWLGAICLAVPLTRRMPSRQFALLLIVVAVALRIVVAACFLGRSPSGDAQSYLTLAAGLVRGEGLRIYEPYIGSTLHAFYPPVYPLVLAGWTAVFGASTGALLGLNALIDGAAALLLCRLGAMPGRAGAGRSAAWLYLIWPSVLLSAPLAQKEGLCVLLILCLATAWLKAIAGDVQWRRSIEIGVVTGLLAMTQPGLAPLTLLFGLALIPLASLRRIVAVGVGAMPFAALAMLPWWLRNHAVLGAFVPLTSAGRISLWVGNNPGATGNWVAPPLALRGLPELEYARAAGALARTWIVGHPADFVRLSATKFVRALGVGEFGVERLALEKPSPTRALTSLVFPIAQFSHLFLLGGAAFVLGRRHRRIAVPLILLLLASGLQLAIFGVWFEFGERHRDFLTPLLLLAIAMAFRPNLNAGIVPSNASQSC